MAVRTWETGMNFEVWRYLGKCGSCGSTEAHKYGYSGNSKILLKVLPKAKIFRYYVNGKQIHAGNLTDLITYLNSI